MPPADLFQFQRCNFLSELNKCSFLFELFAFLLFKQIVLIQDI